MKNLNVINREEINNEDKDIENIIEQEDDISHIVVLPTDEGLRIDKYLTRELADYSRSQLQNLIKDKQVFVNNNPIKSNYKIKENDQIEVQHPEVEDVEILAEDIKLNIVYEDDALLVINKPAGMVVHPAKGHYSKTLVNALLFYCQGLSTVNGPLRPGIVHRLDKDTTGLILVAKTDVAHRLLAEQFQKKEVIRKYVAIVHGILPKANGEIIAPIGRHPSSRQRMAVDPDKGKEAITKFSLLENLGEYSLLELELITGRTHQIRVHMEYIKHPIFGDPTYGYRKDKTAKGQLLHAKYLQFRHPISSEIIEIQADLPAYFSDYLKELKESQ